MKEYLKPFVFGVITGLSILTIYIATDQSNEQKHSDSFILFEVPGSIYIDSLAFEPMPFDSVICDTIPVQFKKPEPFETWVN